MKKLVLLISFLAIPVCSFAQVADTVYTKNGDKYVGTHYGSDSASVYMLDSVLNKIPRNTIAHTSFVDWWDMENQTTTASVMKTTGKYTREDKIGQDNKPAGDYLIQAAKQQYAAYGLMAGAAVFAIIGANIKEDIGVKSGNNSSYSSTQQPETYDKNETLRYALYGVAVGCGVAALTCYILSSVNIHKAGIKLNAHTTIGVMPNGVGAIIKF